MTDLYDTLSLTSIENRQMLFDLMILLSEKGIITKEEIQTIFKNRSRNVVTGDNE